MAKKERQTICPICNKKLSFIKQKLEGDIMVCQKHFDEAGIKVSDILNNLGPFTLEEVKERIELLRRSKERLAEEAAGFVPTKQVGNFMAFDDSQKKWAILSPLIGNIERIYSYSDIAGFELVEDGESVAKGGLGRALVGGALFGGVGAIVGGVTGKRKTTDVCNSLRLKITIDSINNPVAYINFIESKTKKDSSGYRVISGAAQECLSILQLICDKQKGKEKETTDSSPSPADEIRRFKQLLDEGIITQEEFDKKKKQLLGL